MWVPTKPPPAVLNSPPRSGRTGESHSPVVHELWVLVVAGSNPASPTKPSRKANMKGEAFVARPVAQLGSREARILPFEVFDRFAAIGVGRVSQPVHRSSAAVAGPWTHGFNTARFRHS